MFQTFPLVIWRGMNYNCVFHFEGTECCQRKGWVPSPSPAVFETRESWQCQKAQGRDKAGLVRPWVSSLALFLAVKSMAELAWHIGSHPAISFTRQPRFARCLSFLSFVSIWNAYLPFSLIFPGSYPSTQLPYQKVMGYSLLTGTGARSPCLRWHQELLRVGGQLGSTR